MTRLTLPWVPNFCKALSGELKVKHIDDEWLRERFEHVALDIYTRELETRARPYKQIYDALIMGEYGTIAIMQRLKRLGFDIVRNTEEATKQYWWDLLLMTDDDDTEYYIEVKLQHETSDDGHEKTCFSFKDPYMDKHMRENHDKLSFVIGWIPQACDDGSLVCSPWVLIDAAALDEQQDLYVRSTKNEGYYLKQRVALSKGLARIINPILQHALPH